MVRAGLNQAQLAESVGTSQSTVSKWQTGSLAPDKLTLERLLAALSASENDRHLCLSLFEEAHLPPEDYRVIHRLGIAQKQADILRREAQASEIIVFELAVVPGLLQSAAYAEGVFRLVQPNITASALRAAVQARLDRSRVLFVAQRRFQFFTGLVWLL